MDDRETRAGGKQGAPAGELSGKSGRSTGRRRVPLGANVAIGVLALFVLIAGAAVAWMMGLQGSMSMSEQDKEELSEVLVAADDDGDEAFYALVIGSDARSEGEVSRSDVIMLARIDPSAPSVTLVSIPRDTMVVGSSGAVEKINAEYNRGPAATVRAVSEFAGVDISHYVEVDFSGIEQVVDALGGVRVNIAEDIAAGNGGMAFSAGEQVLNGEQALAYARERYTVSGGDFGRARAQRQIAEAIVRQVLDASPTEIPGLVSQIAASVTTDLSIPDIVSYALAFQSADGELQIYSAAAPSYALNQGGVSYVATMYNEWRDMMRRVDAGLDPADASAEIPDEQLNDERLGAASNAAGPRDYEELAASSGLTTDDVA